MSALTSRIGKTYIVGSTIISAGIVFLIIIVLLLNSWSAITNIGWDLFTLKWNPSKQQFGILAMLYGTAIVTIIAITIAAPLGILAAIFTSEILPEKYRLLVKSILELLAGIPSIIYGLIGVAFFSRWIEQWFDLQSGRTLLTAGILLAIMILPTIITLVDDAIHSIPEKYREASKGLGLYPHEIVKNTLLPIVRTDIISAVMLAIGRALGETMAVMLVIGSIDKIPTPFYNWLSRPEIS